MKDFSIRVFRQTDAAEVIALWRDCGLTVPWNNPVADIARKVDDSPELFFIGELEGGIVASCMAGYDGHRGWMYYLAVAESVQRRGLAAAMVRHVESELSALGCPKVELMVRNSNTRVSAFYEALGYAPDPVIVLSKRLREDPAWEDA